MANLHIAVLAALWLSGLYLVAKVITYFVNQNTHRKRARQLGCKPAPIAPVGFPFGIPQVIKTIQADREKRFPTFLVEQGAIASEREGRPVTTIQTTLLGQKRFITQDPVNVKAVLATQFKEFGLGDDRINNFAPLLGHGIFSSDGKRWENSRALLRPQFVRDQVSDLDLEESHVQNLMRVITPDVGANRWTSTIDIQVLFFRLTLDSATEFLFGESLDSQIAHLKNTEKENGREKDQDAYLFADSFDRTLGYLATGTRLGKFYWLVHGKEFSKGKAQVHKFAEHYVRAGLAQNPPTITEKLPETTSGHKQKYVFLNALAASTRDPEEIRSQLLSILLAGRDTTASLLGWTFLLLCQHPEIYAKLRTTILSHFGTYTNPTNLSFSELKSCNYLQHVISETLRLFPVVPVNVRRCLVESTTLPRGGGPEGQDPVYIRAGEEIIYSMHVIHRSEALWGPDAQEFRPDRWDGRKSGWEYLPFNGGPRICIGQQFALTEASYVIVRLVQRVVELKGVGIPEKGRERHNLSLTNCPADGVRVQLKIASE